MRIFFFTVILVIIFKNYGYSFKNKSQLVCVFSKVKPDYLSSYKSLCIYREYCAHRTCYGKTVDKTKQIVVCLKIIIHR